MTKLGSLVVAVAVCAGCASKAPPPAATAGGAPASGAALNSAPPASVRTAEAILADSVQATGGAAAWNAHKTVRSKVEIVFQGMGMGGTGDRIVTSAGKSLMVTEMSGLGTAREGTDGKVFWSQDPIMGFRFLEGAEAEQARVEPNWNMEIHAKELFAKLESATETLPDGTPLECVVATPQGRAPGAKLLRRQDPPSSIYRRECAQPRKGDCLFAQSLGTGGRSAASRSPFESKTQLGPITLIVKVKSVTFDEPMDDKMFEPPVPKKRPGRPRRSRRSRVSRKVILCRCEDVTLADVQHAVALGYADLEEVKRYTGFGTGPCQGKECLRAVALATAAAAGRAAGDAEAVHVAAAAGADRAGAVRGPARGRVTAARTQAASMIADADTRSSGPA